MVAFKETDTNELASLLIDEREYKRYIESDGKIIGPTVRRALSRASQSIGDIEVKQCIECNCLYSIPHDNSWGMQQFG